MNSIIISDALAQVTENGIGLGNIFNKFKVNIDNYEKVIKKFSELKLNRPEFKLDDGKANWDAIAKAIEGCDETALSYFKTLDDGNGTINNQSASVEGLGAHLQSTGQAFDFAAIKATLFNAALNAGIMLLASFAIDGIIKAWDKINLTVEEQTEKVNELKSSYEGLKSEYDTLSQKQDITDAEKRRLEYLERRLELDERILKAEEHQLFEEKTGNKFTDWFDKDNYNVQYEKETSIDRMNVDPDNYAFLSRLYDKKMDDIKVTQEQIAEWTKYRDSVAKGSDEWNVYQGHIDSLQNRQTDAMKDLEDSADQMTTNLGKYADNIEYFEERLASGDLSDEEAAIAQAHLNNWQELYNSTDRMIAEIQKLNGTYDDTDDRIAKSIRSIYDDHGSVDRDAYSDDEFGYEKLLEYTSKLTPEQKELWITTTAGINDAEEAIKAFEAELSGVEALSDTDLTPSININGVVSGIEKQVKPVMDAIQSAWADAYDDEGVFKIDPSKALDAVSEVKDAIDSINSNEDLGVTIDTSSLQELSDVLTNTASTEDEVRQAYSNLANAVMNEFLPAMDGMDYAHIRVMQIFLEGLGIMNAEELIIQQLGYTYETYTAAKEAAANAGVNLNADINTTIEQLQQEKEVSDEDKQHIIEYMLVKASASGATIDVSAILASLGEECEWLKETIGWWKQYNALKGHGNQFGDTNLGVTGYTPVGSTGKTTSIKKNKVELPSIPKGAGDARAKAASKAAKAEKEEADVMSELNSEMDKLQSSYKSLCDIKDTYNKYGKITVDQYQELTNMGFNFLAQLVDENGQLGLNASAFEKLAQAKLQEMQIQMARNATDTINGLKTETEAVEYLTFANEKLRDAALGAAEAQLQSAVAAAKMRGEQQGLAAEEIYKGYQASKQLAGNTDFFFEIPKEGKEKKEKEDKTDKLLEAYNKEKAVLEHMLAMDQISKSEYYDRLMTLVKQYFEGDEEHQDQIWDVEESYHDYLESIKETYNWIEIFLDNLAKKANALIDKASKFISWSKKNAMINRAVKATDKQITGQTNAYAYYAEKARKVGLNNSYIDKIQNGTLTMEDMQNESLSGKIEKYQEWLIV